jgi:hypothetical protein
MCFGTQASRQASESVGVDDFHLKAIRCLLTLVFLLPYTTATGLLRASWGIWGEGICRLACCISTTLDEFGSFLQASPSSTRNPMTAWLVWREKTPSFNLSRELLLVLCSPKLQDSLLYQSILLRSMSTRLLLDPAPCRSTCVRTSSTTAG